MDQKKGKLQLINKGSNSEIYLYGSNGNSVVLKVVSSSCSKEVKHLANESKILKLLEHKNIIKMLKYQEKISLQGSGQSKQFLNYRNVLVMENAKHGSLLNFIQKAKPSIKEIRLIFTEICHAVRYLHCNYFVHRDLKLENILVTQGQSKIQIKLADFGFANSTQNNQQTLSSSLKGTKRAYMAPQIHQLITAPTSKYNTLKADIFALGVILFSTVMGRLPFQYGKAEDSHYKFLSENDEEGFWKSHLTRLMKIQNQEGSMIQDFKQLFTQMVNKNPQNRPTIQEICQSAWLQGPKEEINIKRVQVAYQ